MGDGGIGGDGGDDEACVANAEQNVQDVIVTADPCTSAAACQTIER